MTDDPNRVRVGDRVTIYPRGAKKTWVADFWQDDIHRKVSLQDGATRRWRSSGPPSWPPS